MKATGIIRRVDELGRICLPKEIRRVLNIPDGAPMEIFVEDDQIILKKYIPEASLLETINELEAQVKIDFEDIEPTKGREVIAHIKKIRSILKE